jgi:hypothetical protein
LDPTFNQEQILAYQSPAYIKGNILQYKGNSSFLTSKQRYAQIAKGKWTNRTTTWASQTDSVSIPNTTWLKRDNYSLIDLDPNLFIATSAEATFVPDETTCKQKIKTVVADLPFHPFNPSNNPVLPPPPPPNQTTNPTLPPSKTSPPVTVPIAPNGGILVCNQTVYPCSGKLIQERKTVTCTPTPDSDVPGPAILLCWNPGIQTYFPRSRRTYGISSNKFPTGYKFAG